MTENDFRRYLFESCLCWHERIEPTQGVQPGIADTIWSLDIGLTFVELKLAHLEGRLLKSDNIRPAQISWHHNFNKANNGNSIVSLFLFGVADGQSWRVFAAKGDCVRDWRKGLQVGDSGVQELSTRFLLENINAFAGGLV